MSINNKCVVCGRHSVPDSNRAEGHKLNRREDILLSWKNECAKSLCDTLFKNYTTESEVNIFLKYYQQGNYCSGCQQIVRDINFALRQIQAFELQMSALTNKICQLICRNYNKISTKTETASELSRENSIHGSSANYYDCETVSKIYSVLSQMGFTETGNLSDEDTELALYEIKEEIEVENFCKANNVGDNWIPDSQSDINSDLNNYSDRSGFSDEDIKSNTKIEKKKGKRKLKSTDIENEEETLLDFTERESASQEVSARELRRLRRRSFKVPQKKVRQAKGEDVDWNPSINKSSKYVKKGEEKKRGRRPRGSIHHLVLDDNEMALITKYSKEGERFSLKSLTQAEVEFFNKIADSKLSAIDELKLGDLITSLLYKIRRKFRKFSWTANPEPAKLNKMCTEENCGQLFLTEDELDGHVRGEHKGEELPFLCTTCPIKFKNLNHLKAHRYKRHKSVKLSHYYFCEICQKGYTAEEELNEHNLIAHLGPNPFSCAFCETECTSSSTLIEHMHKSHLEIPGETDFQCEECGRYFMNKNGLNIHQRRPCNSNNSKEFKCAICNQSFHSISFLDRHKTDEHDTGVMCDICGKICSSQRTLNRHSVVHSDVCRYSCKLCGKNYKRSAQLRNHERVHAGIRSFICTICGKGFMTSMVLRGHTKTHEPGYIPRKPFRNKRPRPTKQKFLQEPEGSVSTLNSQMVVDAPNQDEQLQQQYLNIQHIQQPSFVPYVTVYNVPQEAQDNIIYYPIPTTQPHTY